MMAAVMEPTELEHTRCPLCGADRAEPVLVAAEPGDFTGPRFQVVCCGQCGLWYTNPRPTAAAIGRFYPDDYVPHQPRRHRSAWLHPPRWWSLAAARILRRCPDRRWLEPHGRMRLLDVGCGSGVFLERMHQQGWRVTGLDVSQKVVRRIRDEMGLSALHGTLPHAELAPSSFDVVTMWQSLEHLHQPLESLKIVRELLVPGGHLVVSVPNIEGLPFRWFGTAWSGLELPRHLTHFTPQSLSEILRRAGFDVGPVRHVRHGSWLKRSTRNARRQGDGRAWHRLLALRPMRAALTWYCLLRRRCDCITVTAVRPARG